MVKLIIFEAGVGLCSSSFCGREALTLWAEEVPLNQKRHRYLLLLKIEYPKRD